MIKARVDRKLFDSRCHIVKGEWESIGTISYDEEKKEIRLTLYGRKDCEKIEGVLNFSGVDTDTIFEVLRSDFDSLEDEKKRIKRKLLGLHAVPSENGGFNLETTFIVGTTRLYIGDREVILTVKPKIPNLDSSRMFIEALSHPQVVPYIKAKETYEILTNEKPIELDEIPDDYLLFLLIHYLSTLNNLLKRGLQKGYKKAVENLRGRIRGRLMVERTIRENWSRGKKHYTHCSYQIYTPDTLENRILKAAFLKARSYIYSLRVMNGTLERWIGRANVEMEAVSSMRIYPTDFSLTTVQRIRPDYRTTLNLARIILRTLGYDPTVETVKERIRHIYPYWIDMNELFERYVEVKLRNGEVGELKGWKVYPGYEWGKGIPTDVGELRPDFVFVKDGEVAIGDAKYKMEYSKGWIKEDLQQIALYGRIRWEGIEDWIKKIHGVDEKVNTNEEPNLYIFYPTQSDKEKEPVESESFRGIYKIGIGVPRKGQNEKG